MKSLSLSQPHLLIMVGIPGSGKSFFAKQFSDMFHAPYVDFAKILDMSRRDGDMSAHYVTHLLKELFKTKATIVVDGLGDTKAQRTELKNLAAAAGYKAMLVWVQTDGATAKSRAVKASKKAGRPVSDYEYEKIVSGFSIPTVGEQPVIVLSGKHTFATQARVVLKNLASPREAMQPQPTAAPRRQQPEQGSPAGKRNIAIQ